RGDYLPTNKKIDEIIESCIPENTCKATQKWVKALNRWWNNVGYCYYIEMVTSKDQLEKEMTEFFCGVQKIQDRSDYSLSSLVNAYNCLSNYIYKHPGGSQKFVINNKSEFSLLWEVLNEKMKVFMWCCLLFAPRGGEHSQMKVTQFTFLIPVDPEGYLVLVHDIKLYLSKRPTNCACQFLYLKINKDIYDRDIVNHSERTTPITHLFREGILIVTSMSITSHKSESSYCIYSRPSEQQKKDVLSTLISVTDLPESWDNDGVEDFSIKNKI
ncbi:29202_t:CDS:2, partial [Racocetra persica]